MRQSVSTILTAALFLSACQSPTSTRPTETDPGTPIPTLSPTTVSSITSTPTDIDLPNSTPAAEMRLPPGEEVLKRLDIAEAQIYALTIDDGFGKMPFDDIMDELSARNLHATFFLIAQAAVSLGEERMQRLAEEGHTIAYHSYSHDDLLLLEEWGQNDWLNDYTAWGEAMRTLMGDDLYTQTVRPYARAPYGLFNQPFLAMTEEIGLIPVGWSRDPGDLNVGLMLRPGDIFLLHVRYPDSELLPGLLDEIDLRPVSLDELFAAWNPQ